MSFLYRVALRITRCQAYNDWAASLDDEGADLRTHLEEDRRTVYLGPETADDPSLESLVEEFWEDIFELELAAWMEDSSTWPAPRTREMFDEWFDVELTDTVVDLVPEEPLTQQQLDAADIGHLLAHCAWCELELEEERGGRFVGFRLSDRDSFAFAEGGVLSVPVRDGGVLAGIMSAADSEAAAEAEDLIFRVCSSRCEKLVRKHVPRGLRRLQEQLGRLTEE